MFTPERPNLNNLNRIADPPKKPVSIEHRFNSLKHWKEFQVKPTIIEPCRIFEPRLKFFKFGLRIPTKTTLTPEIINLPQVQSKILTPAESEMDNCPITVKELSHALDWMDRYSYAVLKCFEHKVLEKITSQSLKA